MKAKKILAHVTALLLASSPMARAEASNSLPPVRIILVGDSTMAVHSGWGPGFSADLVPAVTFINMAKGGRSSGSYRTEGSWTNVMNELNRKGDFKTTYVLIQFGHNDQPRKPGRSTDLATEFPANMRYYVQDVKAAGARPVLITPLTRRMFKNGKVRNELSAWADATRKVAQEESVSLLELNADSAAAVQQMGPTEANTLAMAPPPASVANTAASGDSAPAPKPGARPDANSVGLLTNAVPANNVVERKGTAAPAFDYTHLGSKGSAYFARMVCDELINTVPELKPYILPKK
jgi:lysophospholipase L1-like esterase